MEMEKDGKKKALPPEEFYKCPVCKGPIKNFEKLKLKTVYKCGQTSCAALFFVEKYPKYFIQLPPV